MSNLNEAQHLCTEMEADVITEVDRMLHPRSVAIIGASAKKGKLGHLYMDCFSFMRFEKLYPVNPHEGEILGYKAYPSINDVPDEVDLALVLTPPGAVLSTVRECIQKGVKGVIITTSGFKEKNEEGRRLEEEICRVARESGIRVLGPNCIGIYCPSSKLPFPLKPGRESGNIGVVSQSGSFADMLTWMCSAKGVNFSKAISCGNECDLTALDFLEYLGQDPETKLLVAYIEGIKEGKRFLKLARHISWNKPFIVWKCGRTEAGAKAASSHTGALSGSSRVWEAVVSQTGIISVGSFEEVLDTMFAFHFLPLTQGRRVAIVSGPGGPAVGATDECLELGLQLAPLSLQTRERLGKIIPAVGTSTANPVDLSIASALAPQVYGEVIKVLDGDEGVDMLLVIGVGGKEFDDMMSRLIKGVRKPLALVLGMIPDTIADEYHFLFQKGIVVYPDSKRAAKALLKMVRYAEFLRAES